MVQRKAKHRALWSAVSAMALAAWGAAEASPGLRTSLDASTATRVEIDESEGAHLVADAGESLEVLFADGSSLLLAPGASVRIDRYRFDESTGAGGLEMTLERGSVRVILGRLHGDHALALHAGEARVLLEQGAAEIALADGQARAALLFGGPLSVENDGGRTQIARAGFESTVSAGARPSAARRQNEEQDFAALLERRQSEAASADAASDDNDVLGVPPITLVSFDRNGAGLTAIGSGITLGDSAQLYTDQVNQGLSGNATFNAFLSALRDQSVLLRGGALRSNLPDPAVQAQNQPRTTNRLVPLGDGYLPSDENARMSRGSNAGVAYTLSGPLILPAIEFAGIDPPYDDADVEQALRYMGLVTNAGLCATAGCAELAAFVRLAMLGEGDLRIVLGNVQQVSITPRPGQPPVTEIDNLSAQNQVLSLPNSVLAQTQDGVAQIGVNATSQRVAPGLSPPGPVNGGTGIGGTGITSDLVQSAAIASVLQSGFSGDARAQDHFLYVEAAIEAPSELPGAPDIQRFVFATGGLGARSPADTIDSFALMRGLGDVQDGQLASAGRLADGARGFVPGDSRVFDSFAATDLYIANTSGPGQNALLQADLGFSNGGALSSISATIGALIYASNDAQVLARTIGSTRDGAGAVSTLSPLTNTSFGGGNLWNGDTLRPGYAGYLVLENLAEGLPPPDASLTGSLEFAGGAVTPLGGETQNYGVFRLAAGETSVSDANQSTQSLGGFVAGLVERASAEGVALGFLDSGGGSSTAGGDPRRFGLSYDAATNRVEARLVLRDETGADLAPIMLGGLTDGAGPSAFIRDGLYGAASRGDAGHALALLAGDELNAAIGSYDYVQWGYFFGDLGTASGAHVHLASWAAGEILAPTNYALQGGASYAGHVLGSVADASGVREVQGSFTQSWNFDARTGAMNLEFDGQSYSAPELALSDVTTDLRYSGLFEANAGRAGQIDGVLVGETPGNLPGGSVGQFGIQNLPGAPGYIASGTFGGDIAGQ